MPGVQTDSRFWNWCWHHLHDIHASAFRTPPTRTGFEHYALLLRSACWFLSRRAKGGWGWGVAQKYIWPPLLRGIWRRVRHKNKNSITSGGHFSPSPCEWNTSSCYLCRNTVCLFLLFLAASRLPFSVKFIFPPVCSAASPAHRFCLPSQPPPPPPPPVSLCCFLCWSSSVTRASRVPARAARQWNANSLHRYRWPTWLPAGAAGQFTLPAKTKQIMENCIM